MSSFAEQWVFLKIISGGLLHVVFFKNVCSQTRTDLNVLSFMDVLWNR